MSRRQEVCRDFQRGNCRFGSRCKFLHQSNQPQQRLPQQNQNQKQDVFDGGGGRNYYGALSNPAPQRQSQNPQSQSSTKDHKCNDPRLCKEQIKEDFASEHPIYWRLTCYAHYKFLPNDIVGDVSPEELRALAYEGAKQGLSLTDLSQREGTMIAAKNAEFEALLRNHYRGPASQSASVFPSNSFSSSPFLGSPQNNSTVMVFGQPLTLSNPSPSPSTFGPTPNSFAVPAFNSSQLSGDITFGTKSSSGNASPFGQPTNLFQQSPFSSTPAVSQQSPFSIPQQGFNSPVSGNGFQSPLSPANPFTQSPFSFNPSPQGFAVNTGTVPTITTTQSNFPATNLSTPASQMIPSTPVDMASNMHAGEDGKWLKDVWKIGEIPEGEPPVHVRF